MYLCLWYVLVRYNRTHWMYLRQKLVRYTHQKFIASIYLTLCCVQKDTPKNLMLHSESTEHLHTKYLQDTFACYCPTHDEVLQVAYPTVVLGICNSNLPHACFMSLYLLTPIIHSTVQYSKYNFYFLFRIANRKAHNTLRTALRTPLLPKCRYRPTAAIAAKCDTSSAKFFYAFNNSFTSFNYICMHGV